MTDILTRILDIPIDQHDRAVERDLIDSFDPDDDLETVLRDTRAERVLLNPPKKKISPSLDNPTLEAIAQQIASRLGRAIPAKPKKSGSMSQLARADARADARVGALLASADRLMGIKTPLKTPSKTGSKTGSRDVAPEPVEHPGTWANYIFSSPTVQNIYQMRTAGRAGAGAVLMENGKVALLDVGGNVEKVEAPVMVHPIVAPPVALAAPPGVTSFGPFVVVKSNKPKGTVASTQNAGKPSIDSGKKQGSTAYAPDGLQSEPRGLLDVFDPRHNMREMAKELLLLEDHVAQPAKHCPDCIRKHLLRSEALAEEAVQLDVDGEYQEYLLPLPGQIRNLQRAFLDNEAVSDRAASLKGRLALQQQVRSMRKVLSKRGFSALAFKPSEPVDPALGPVGAPIYPLPGDLGTVSGSAARTPIVFAMDRGSDARVGMEAEETRERAGHRTGRIQARLGADTSLVLDPLPSTVMAALRRRVSAGDLQNNPIPVLYRTRDTPGPTSLTTVGEGLVTNLRGEGELVVQTLQVPPRTVIVPIGDAVLDLSGDEAFTAIPWPDSLPVTRDLSGRGARGVDSATQAGRAESFSISKEEHPNRWLMIRLIASVLWPVVDGFALRMVQEISPVVPAEPATTPASPPASSVKLGIAPVMSLPDAARRAILQRLLVAAVVNAVYESGLDSGIEGDLGHAVGLFQLRDDGAGIGMSKAARKDPFLNTGRIGQRFLEVRKFFERLGKAEAAVPGSTAPSEWTEAFTRYVEAPGAIPGKPGLVEKVRGDTTAASFTRQSLDIPHAPAEVVVAPEVEDTGFRPGVWVIGGIAAVAAAVGVGTAWNTYQKKQAYPKNQIMNRFSR